MKQIDCVIGIIEYKEPDNLQLQLLMEALKEKIESSSANDVLKLLNS